MSNTKAVLEKLRDQIDSDRGMLSGIDGYNYASGEEYGMRKAMRFIDEAIAHLPTEAAKGVRAEELLRRISYWLKDMKSNPTPPDEPIADNGGTVWQYYQWEASEYLNRILSHFDAKPEASVEGKYDGLRKRYEEMRSMCLQAGNVHPETKAVCHQALASSAAKGIPPIAYHMAELLDDMMLALTPGELSGGEGK